ncbi:GEVED domain-containing protein [Moheibacter sp.]|uniref:GEVED domain-containing protein n=1 Tax=Moheibacter sp. TaxID=1965316 RepID=UPI003C75E44B
MKKFLCSLMLFIGIYGFSQVQYNLLEGFGMAIYDINNEGKAVHGNGYYDFISNTSNTSESGVAETKSINNADQILGVYNGTPAYRNEGVWTEFANMDSNYEYTLYDISENGIYAVGQTSNDAFESWPFIYNIQTQTLTVLSSDLYEYGAAYGVNNDGIAVGWMDDLPTGTLRMPAYFSEDGTISLISEAGGEASSISDNNIIVGGINGAPFVFDIATEELTSVGFPEGTLSATFSDISETGVIIGYGTLPGFLRQPLIYHPSLGDEALALADVLAQFGIDASTMVGTAYRISSDGNYICGWGDGPAFMAPGWAVFFDDMLLMESECSLECPLNIVVDAELGEAEVVVYYEITFSCDGETPEGTEIILVNGLPSGSAFPLGTTTIYHELRDGDGNVMDSCSFTVTVNDAYCNVTYEFYTEPITYVEFAGIENNSSAELGTTPFNEYFLDIEGTVNQGGSYPIALEGNTGGNYINYFTVFIDWNQDGDFNDANETYPIGSISNSTGADGQQATGTIEVPADATIGQTRMRVVKNYDVSPTNPCGEYQYGQTEDYTLNIGELGIGDINTSSFSYYPNPVTDILNISSDKAVRAINVYNMAGQLVSSLKTSSNQINLSALPGGVYVIKAELEGGVAKIFKVVKK